MKRLGVVGAMVWDTIHGRDPAQPAVEEWGGIAYALAGMDAALPADWEIVPLIKVGQDLAERATSFLRTLRRPGPGARFILVPELNNRVTLHYESAERRCEVMSGGVPPWTWPELGPLVGDLDALYVNFISGYEMTLETARHLRRAFRGPIYGDLHSLFLGRRSDGMRVLQPLPDSEGWLSCFDWLQLNEDEMAQLGDDPMSVAAEALAAGCRGLVVTLGTRGVAYFDRAGVAGPVRTARISLAEAGAELVAGGDPTGCGDVFGAVTCAALLGGAPLVDAVAAGIRLASRNAAHRGASGLRDHLLGRLATV